MLSPLRNRVFRFLWAMYTANSMLEWFSSIALMVLVYEHSQSTALAAAMLLCKQVAPAAVVPFLATRLDRTGVTRGLGLSFLGQAAALAALGLSGFTAAVFPLAVIAGTAGTLVRTMLRTGVARTLDGEEFRAGNALLNITMGIAALAGPALAALAVATIGAADGLVLTGALLAACALAATMMPAVAPRTGGDEHTDDLAATEFEAGATMGGDVRSPVGLNALLFLAAIVTCLFAMDEPALLAYSEHSLGAGVGGYGAIFTAWGVGVTVGSVLFTRLLHWPMLRVYALAITLAGLSYIGLGVSPTIVVACAVAVVGGVGNGLEWVSIVTAVQEAAPSGGEASAASRLESIATAAPGIGILIGGVVAEFATPRVTLMVPGVLSLVLLASVLLVVRVQRSGAVVGAPALVAVPQEQAS